MTKDIGTKCSSCLAIKDPKTGKYVPMGKERHQELGRYYQRRGGFSDGLCPECVPEKEAEINNYLSKRGKNLIKVS